MKITISRAQWEGIGKQAGWLGAEAKKKKEYKHSPKEHGFIDECIEKNQDKNSPGGYCSQIVTNVKGSDAWRKKKD